jgi:iron uptake system component EfeO
MLILAAGAATSLLTACTHAGKPSAQASEIEVSTSHCGVGWSDPRVGQQTLVVHNTDTRTGQMSLVNASSNAVFAEVDHLGPGTRASLAVDLPPGSFAFRCAMGDEDVISGPTVVIKGGQPGGNSNAVVPVSQGDLVEAVGQYEVYVGQQLPALTAQCNALAEDLSLGNLAAARADWLTAHLTYERLGGAYGAFGDADGVINGLPSGLPDGVDDKDFTGFHRIEYGLWSGQPASELAPIASDLVGLIGELQEDSVSAEEEALDLAIRAHEITENALQFELTGRSDFGSHSTLATINANLQGTTQVINVLKSLLVTRYPNEATTEAWLQRTQNDIAPLIGTPLVSLSHATRQRLNADLSQLSELLAPIASILEPRRTA